MTARPIEKGNYRAETLQSLKDPDGVRSFRARCFDTPGGRDPDPADFACQHVLIRDTCSGELVGYFRLCDLTSADVLDCYAGRYYDLSLMQRYSGPMLEIGRFCISPNRCDPDIVRLAWSALTQYSDRRNIRMLFGCASFQGVDVAKYKDAFSLLRIRYQAPPCWAPKIKSPSVHVLEDLPRNGFDMSRAQRQMPPLLRSYLAMGARVSDHAVIDHAMNTVHVFTGLEVSMIPASRKRLLRALS